MAEQAVKLSTLVETVHIDLVRVTPQLKPTYEKVYYRQKRGEEGSPYQANMNFISNIFLLGNSKLNETKVGPRYPIEIDNTPFPKQDFNFSSISNGGIMVNVTYRVQQISLHSELNR